MRASTFVIAAGLVALSMAGCNKDETHVHAPQDEHGRVAVVDLNEVARRLGRDQYMAAALKQSQQSLNEQLGVVQAAYVKEIEKKKEELGIVGEDVELNDEAVKTLLGMRQQANVNLNQARQQAISSLGQVRTKLIADFRSEVRPVASQVAKDKGLSVVLTKNDSVLFTHDDAIDITDEVAKQLKASGSSPAVSTAQQPRAVQPANQGTQQK